VKRFELELPAHSMLQWTMQHEMLDNLSSLGSTWSQCWRQQLPIIEHLITLHSRRQQKQGALINRVRRDAEQKKPEVVGLVVEIAACSEEQCIAVL
jgi:hypothetical protein